MNNILQLLEEKGIRPLASQIFLRNLEKAKYIDSGYIKSSDISPIEKTDLTYREEDFENHSQNFLLELNKVAVIKLNGGLGTSMGLNGPKSQLKVKNNLNFLEITCFQIQKFREKYGIQIPLIFMNSFNTDAETKANLNKLNFSNSNLPTTFLENKSPKLKKIVDLDGKISFHPAKYLKDSSLEWAPPGHADVYPAIYETGLLQELINLGYEYLFISNVDNLGASFNIHIFKNFLILNSDFAMEVALRTENDKKGGHLALLKDKLILREVAQVRSEDLDDFQNFNKYKFFNTNSIWIKTKALKKLLDENNGILDLPVILNEKNINPQDSESEKIIQIETAMGSAISLFENSKTILIPSKRFIPVKNTNNLLFLLSDLVSMSENFELNPIKHIYIELNPKYYKNVDEFFNHFKVIPNLSKCISFKINEEKYFNKLETFEGNIEL